MTSEDFYIMISCNSCGNEVEIPVTEEYLLEEKVFSVECKYCKNLVKAK